MNRRDCIASMVLTCAAWACGAQAAPGKTARILVLGDSISAEYGLARGTGWVALLEKQIAADRLDARVVNASVSGDTTSGGRSRLPALLKTHQPTLVILELGANDALRGLPLKNTDDNLSWMIEQSQKAGAKVLLVGMQVPPNYGGKYTQQFGEVFPAVARKYQTALVPFLLKGVADDADPTRLFQTDRIHPNATAQPLLLANVWPVLKPMLQ
ncbi:arylesterase [Diaphorobacter aerolatus]|uniref:Arylesterase n=1 Tax=Diaphorobacter aerolatus TaxID=1288495 RepID=A0A7H0GKE2_9BURK|nr:arylesterase [Diaphorobacter aerolatus]QNP48758.1 arylesterase [Diaphorobacter aerolatus]